jgi:hypothetical protein
VESGIANQTPAHASAAIIDSQSVKTLGRRAVLRVDWAQSEAGKGLEQVLDWATARGYREGLNPARWRGHLNKLLARPSKVADVEHHAALPFTDIGDFMQRLREAKGIGARAFEFAILTAARSGEVRGATGDILWELWIEGFGDLFEKRRRLMADWATFCGRTQPKGGVVSIRRDNAS